MSIENLREWEAKNPEKVKEYRHQWYLKHKELVIGRTKLWKKNNPYKYKENSRKAQDIYRSKNPEKAKLSRRKCYRKYHPYKVGVCEMCGIKIEGKSYHQDHNHITNQIRGSLCPRCNTGLGFVENQIYMDLALNYLIKYDLMNR